VVLIIDKNKNRCYNIDTVKEGAKEMDAFLKFDDLDDNRTDTYKVLTRIANERASYLEKADRLRQFDLYLTNWLMRHKSMTYAEYDLLMAWYGHSQYTIPEIFRIVFRDRT
jgi:hypothetical protein